MPLNSTLRNRQYSKFHFIYILLQLNRMKKEGRWQTFLIYFWQRLDWMMRLKYVTTGIHSGAKWASFALLNIWPPASRTAGLRNLPCGLAESEGIPGWVYTDTCCVRSVFNLLSKLKSLESFLSSSRLDREEGGRRLKLSSKNFYIGLGLRKFSLYEI